MTFFGIIPLGDLKLRDEYPLVKAACHYVIEDVYLVANLVQYYTANTSLDRDVDYFFPLPPDAAVCAFKAIIDDTIIIKGEVKEKEQAKRDYQEAVAAGKYAGLLEQAAEDVFRVSLGNIKRQSKVAVHISYTSVISHDASSPEQLRLTVPTVIAPRYGIAPKDLPLWGPNAGNRMDLSVSIHMTQPVTAVSSPTHPIAMTLGSVTKEVSGDFQPNKAFVYLHEEKTFLEKDVVILVSSPKLDFPRCTVERLLPLGDVQEITDAYALTLVPRFDLPPLPAQEYIFLVDRSGSMEGSRMEQVKAALQIMLRSLPSDNTYFNIVSFGSSHDSLWNRSRLYSATTVEEASKHIDTMGATYGGTELASAFAFASESKTNDVHEGKPIPTSVFVLTDGEAWDVSGVFANVSSAVDQAKEQNNLFRAFCLGVGDDVSTSMCEGIVRAGKGVAVFVGNNEKPDAKLMNLLRAARGPIIEDLQVDWGVSEISEQTKDEGYEIVAADGPAPPPVAPPTNISLFDASNTANTAPELGPKEQPVVHPPPLRIQQAPRTENLPIPLYPGFRCSVFAIIRQPSTNEPFSSAVRIHGQVLGSPVSLEIPVQPVTTEAAHISNENVPLLHTLAARALIQGWEDKEKTDVTRAEIVRLGRRYSLASSATSFVAVETAIHFSERKEKEEKVMPIVPMLANHRYQRASQRVAQQDIDAVMARGERLEALVERTDALSVSAQAFRKAKPKAMGSASGSSLKKSSGKGEVLQNFFQNLWSRPGASSSARPAPPPPVMAPAIKRSYIAPPVYSIQSEGGSQSSTLEDDDEEDASFSLSLADDVAPSPMSPPIAAQPSAASPALTLTVEWVARSQKFDGSFPTTSNFLSVLLGSAALPVLPSGLSTCPGSKEVKDSIWVTLLTLAVLEKRFASEKDAWELLAEKSIRFVETVLAGTLVTGNVRVGEFLAGLRGEAAKHV